MSDHARTLGDLRRGLCRTAEPREPACDESAMLWDAIGLSEDTPIEMLLERWTPLAACMLARADGTGPRVGAVAWVEERLDISVLRGADLRGADLSTASLRGANLRYADLRDAILGDADLRGAYLRGSNLRGAYLRDADLRGAYLRGANLRGANLPGADLSGTYRPEGGVPGWHPDERGRLCRVGGDNE